MNVGDRYEIEIHAGGKVELKRGTIERVGQCGKVAILRIDGRRVEAFASQLRPVATPKAGA